MLSIRLTNNEEKFVIRESQQKFCTYTMIFFPKYITHIRVYGTVSLFDYDFYVYGY